MQGKGASESNQLLLLLLFEWSYVTMHCFKMLLFLFSATEITLLHIHILKFMPNDEAKKCWTQIFSLAGKLHNILQLAEIGIVLPISNAKVQSFFNIYRNNDKRLVSKIYVKVVFDFSSWTLKATLRPKNLQFLSEIFCRDYAFDNSQCHWFKV